MITICDCEWWLTVIDWKFGTIESSTVKKCTVSFVKYTTLKRLSPPKKTVCKSEIVMSHHVSNNPITLYLTVHYAMTRQFYSKLLELNPQRSSQQSNYNLKFPNEASQLKYKQTGCHPTPKDNNFRWARQSKTDIYSF